MKRNNMTMPELLLEAVGIVVAVIYIGLQIFYGIYYGVNAWTVIMNVAAMLLVYGGLTLLCIYPEKVNGLTKEICSGKIRTYTIRMVRMIKLIFVAGILFTSICDILGQEIKAGYSLVILVLIVVTAFIYEYKIIRILRQNFKK